MEQNLPVRVTIRGFGEADLDSIVEIDRKVLGKARRDYWKNTSIFRSTHYPLSCLVAESDGKVSGSSSAR